MYEDFIEKEPKSNNDDVVPVIITVGILTFVVIVVGLCGDCIFACWLRPCKDPHETIHTLDLADTYKRRQTAKFSEAYEDAHLEAAEKAAKEDAYHKYDFQTMKEFCAAKFENELNEEKNAYQAVKSWKRYGRRTGKTFKNYKYSRLSATDDMEMTNTNIMGKDKFYAELMESCLKDPQTENIPDTEQFKKELRIYSDKFYDSFTDCMEEAIKEIKMKNKETSKNSINEHLFS